MHAAKTLGLNKLLISTACGKVEPNFFILIVWPKMAPIDYIYLNALSPVGETV